MKRRLRTRYRPWPWEQVLIQYYGPGGCSHHRVVDMSGGCELCNRIIKLSKWHYVYPYLLTWPFRSEFYSMCSKHQTQDLNCKMCWTGNDRNNMAQLIDRFIYWIAPKLYQKWKN